MGILGAATVVLSGCGQKGPLFLPTEAASSQRATLPQLIVPLPAASSSTAPPSR
ncbi:MAG: lipoprotein [Burkholderiaceae bacterium]|nr:lipoprotein [Burkholderiaceae bacterium]